MKLSLYEKFVVLAWFVWFIAACTFAVAIFYTGYHFISKYW